MKNLFLILSISSLLYSGYYHFEADKSASLYIQKKSELIKISDNRLENSCVNTLQKHFDSKHIYQLSAMKTAFYNFKGNIMPEPYVDHCEAVDQFGGMTDGRPTITATLFQCSTHMHSYAGKPQSYIACFTDGKDVKNVKAVKVYFDPGWHGATIKPGWKMNGKPKGLAFEYLPHGSTFGKGDDRLLQGSVATAPSAYFQRDTKAIYGENPEFHTTNSDNFSQAAKLKEQQKGFEDQPIIKGYLAAAVFFIGFLVMRRREVDENLQGTLMTQEEEFDAIRRKQENQRHIQSIFDDINKK